MHGFTYNADGEGIEHRGYTAGEGDDFESRAIGSGPYTYKGITFAPTGRKGRYADGKLELIYEYESKVGEVIWVTETGRVFPPSAMPGVLKPANWRPSDPSHFPGYKGRSAAADVESRRWQKDFFAIPREMPVSIARGGRVYLYNELDENGRRTGKQAWFDFSGNEIPDSVVRQKGKLAKGTYPSRSASEDDDFEARRFGDAESRGLPPATVKGTFGTYHRMDLGDQYFMRRGPYERVWKYVCFGSNGKPVDYCFVNEKGRVFYSLAG